MKPRSNFLQQLQRRRGTATAGKPASEMTDAERAARIEELEWEVRKAQIRRLEELRSGAAGGEGVGASGAPSGSRTLADVLREQGRKRPRWR